MSSKTFAQVIIGLFSILAVPSAAEADPVQCYIGSARSFQVCDLERRGNSQYLLSWPDREYTTITERSTASGSWYKVSHLRPNGDPYGGGTRYPRVHYERGRWICYHKRPGGSSIDFCLRP